MSKQSRWTLAIVSIALFMVTLDNLVVTNALVSIREDLGASLEDLEWTVNAYTLSYAVFLLTAAALGDRFGRRLVFAVGIGVFTLSSAAAALAPSTDALIAARAFQGLGGAVITPLSLTLLSEAFAAEKRGLALGIWSGVSGLGVALGPVVGGAVVEGFSWQWIFWLNVPIGLALVPAALRVLSESRGAHARVDLPGVALASGGLLGVVFGIVRAQELGWTSTTVIASIAAGTALLAAFAVWETRTPTPMLPMQFFRNRTFAATNGVSLAMFFGAFGSIFLLAQFFQVAQGYSPLEAGLRTLPWTAMPIFVAPVAGILSDRIGSRPLMAAGLALQAAALTWIAIVTDARHVVRARGPRLRHGRHRHGAGVRAGGERGARRGAARPGRPGLGRDQHRPRDRRGAGRGRAGDGVHRSRRVRVAAGLCRRADPGRVGRRGGAGGRSAGGAAGAGQAGRGRGRRPASANDEQVTEAVAA